MHHSAYFVLLALLLAACTSESPDPLVRDMTQSPPLQEDMADGGDMQRDEPDAAELSAFMLGDVPAPPTQDLEACGAPKFGQDLNVCTASYLGGDGADEVTHVAIAPDGSIILGGVFPGVKGYGPVNNEFGFGGDAAIVKLDPTGRKILAWSHVGSLVSALDVSPRDGTIVVGGSFGVMALDLSMQTQVFTRNAHAPVLIDVGFSGEIATLDGKRVAVYSADGLELLGSFEVEETQVHAVVVDSWNKRVVMAGYDQVSLTLQQPFVTSYDFSGEVSWRAWGWSQEQAGELGADTRAMALAMGHDGKLYCAGEAVGGETVFRRSPRDVNVAQALQEQDEYARVANVKQGASIGFIARMTPGTGEVEAATFLLTRLASGEGHDARPMALAANERGQVVVVGDSGCCIKGGAQSTVVGQPAMPGYAGGAFVAVFEGEALERTLWTALHGGARAMVRDVDAWGGVTAIVHHHRAAEDASTLEGQMVTYESFFEGPQGGTSDVHITVIPMP